MLWIFASVVLVVAVYSPGFRKVVYWCLGIGAFVIAFSLINIALQHHG